MKGPYERLKYDFRRVWECPVCHHRERTDGSGTSCLCRCQKKLAPGAVVWMRLVDDGPRRADTTSATAAPLNAPIPDAATDDPDDELTDVSTSAASSRVTASASSGAAGDAPADVADDSDAGQSNTASV